MHSVCTSQRILNSDVWKEVIALRSYKTNSAKLSKVYMTSIQTKFCQLRFRGVRFSWLSKHLYHLFFNFQSTTSKIKLPHFAFRRFKDIGFQDILCRLFRLIQNIRRKPFGIYPSTNEYCPIDFIEKQFSQHKCVIWSVIGHLLRTSQSLYLKVNNCLQYLA